MGGLGCDNMTVVLVCYTHGKSFEDLALRCASMPLNQVQAHRGNGHAAGELNSEGGSPESSCSSSTAETPDEDTPPILSMNPISVDGEGHADLEEGLEQELMRSGESKAALASPPDGLALA